MGAVPVPSLGIRANAGVGRWNMASPWEELQEHKVTPGTSPHLWRHHGMGHRPCHLNPIPTLTARGTRPPGIVLLQVMVPQLCPH